MTTVTGPALLLSADCLLSKWGFSDGDILFDYLWVALELDNTPAGEAMGGPAAATSQEVYQRFQEVDEHAVLRRLVREHLVPALEAAGHRLEVYDIETNHNPIRARTVDGVEVDDYDRDGSNPQLRVKYVEVPREVVLREAGLEVVAGEVISG